MSSAFHNMYVRIYTYILIHTLVHTHVHVHVRTHVELTARPTVQYTKVSGRALLSFYSILVYSYVRSYVCVIHCMLCIVQ